METSKEAKTVLKQTQDIFKDILSPTLERGANPYVYFYRIIGCDDEQDYVARVISLDEQLLLTGNYICFDKLIPLTTDSEIIERARQLFEPVPLKDFSNGALLNVLESKGYFSITSVSQMNRRVKNAFGIILDLYLKNEKTQNLNIVINFSTKILLWFGDYGKQIHKKSSYNPKVVYWGSPQKHEIYFLILMSLIGCDVLVLNPSFQDKFDKVDKYNEFSMILKHSQELSIGDFPSSKPRGLVHPLTAINKTDLRGIAQPTDDPLEFNSSPSSSEKPILLVKLKITDTILEEILVPLNKRTGYVGIPYPILPVYFVRYIGVPSSSDDWEAEYYNSLYNLDKALRRSGFFLSFMEGIPAPTAEEGALIPQRLIGYPFRDWFEIIQQIIKAQVLPQTFDALLDNTIRKTFVDLVTLFAEKSSNANTSIVLNFSIKMISWLNRYISQLFPKRNSNQTSGSWLNDSHNPKILFYGPIKVHEIYLLMAFHRLGCDVLFIHSDEAGDTPFQTIDQGNALTHLIKNKHNLSLVPFPQEERSIRKSTIAYSASKEIEEVIYGEEVGLFKAWQFESYGTQPITLKTTYDELKILWKEPSKLRPEFKVQNKKVYVPNLFAKINGVSEDLKAYWQDFKYLSSAPNTRLVEDVPFTKQGYTKQELYQSSYLLNEQGLLDEFKASKSRHYKFAYLKAPLQHFLIVKINELLLSEFFQEGVDEKFKLKIIMTILTIEDELLKLIEVFDYPQEVSKVIVYDHEKETFNESDAIILAYLNLIGLDVLIFTPTNYKTIEHFIKPSFFDLHQFPLVKYDLGLPTLNSIPATPTQKPGLLSRFFKLR